MLTIEMAADEATLTITLPSRLDGKIREEFLATFRQQAKPSSHYVIDLAKTSYIDSTGLGMLMILRQHAGNDKAQVWLINCSAQIKSILTIANFQALLTVA